MCFLLVYKKKPATKKMPCKTQKAGNGTCMRTSRCVHSRSATIACMPYSVHQSVNLLNPELNSICYLVALLGAYHFLHVSRIRVK